VEESDSWITALFENRYNEYLLLKFISATITPLNSHFNTVLKLHHPTFHLKMNITFFLSLASLEMKTNR